ncbi:MAG: hypothetical protein AB2L24_21715 [Mangrovibacterium sp.]
MKEFFDYYASLPKKQQQAFRKKIIKACMIEPPTWYSWMRRNTIPKPAQKLISIEMNKPIEELFPNN